MSHWQFLLFSLKEKHYYCHRSAKGGIAVTYGPKVRFSPLPKSVLGWGHEPPKLKILRNFGIYRMFPLLDFYKIFSVNAECFP